MLDIPHLEQNVILAPYTTYKIGGPADWFVSAHSSEELARAIHQAREAEMPFFLLGYGANILITDKGFRGLVIHNQTNKIEFLDNHKVKAESGATIADLIEATAEKGLSGLEHFVGIPSTVGGALWQNLHFLSPDRNSTLYIESVIDSATVLVKDEIAASDKAGLAMTQQKVDRDFFRFGYDDSILHHESVIVLDVTFALAPKPESEIRHQMAENMAWRVAKQPQLWEYPSCGSVFKKIEGAGAGRLIDEAGLKGFRIGQAEVSTKHANYLINLGNATAHDILSLISQIQETVAAKTGYHLEPEISIIGEH